jgi:hypothetical protein
MSDVDHPIKDMSDSLLGWATQNELTLAQQLNQPATTIIGELDLASDEWEKIEKLYGIFLFRQLKAGGSLAALVGLSPATFLVTVCARAKKIVATDNFVAEYLGGLGLSDQLHAEMTELLDQKLGEFLGNFQLHTFDEKDPVTSLCHHAGLINTEVPLLLEACDQAEELRLGSVELPYYFAGLAAAAPATAAVLFDAVCALRQFTLDHPRSWFDRSRKQLDPKLPAALDETFVAELRERPVGTADREAAVGVANREMRPRLILDPRRKKVCLRLPEQLVPASGEITWRVSLEGSTTVYRTAPAFGDITGYSEPLDITLPKAVREVTVEDLANHITWNIPVVNTNDPILLFNKRGGSVTDKKSLHHQRLRALTPAETRLVDVVHDTVIEAESSFDIDGWDGWICRNLSLENVDSIAALEVNAQPDLNLLRIVDPRQRVMFRTPDDAIAHVSTMGGLKVHSQSLLAEFPPTPSGQTETWHLSISSFAGVGTAGEEITQPEPLEVPADGGVFEVFDSEAYDAPWVGEYLVRMRGPRNESFRHEFAIVEGMRAVTTYQGSSGSFRIPARGGLSESTLIVKPSSKPFEVNPPHAEVTANQAATDFTVTTEEGDVLPLHFNPPRLNFELPLLSEPPMWRASRMVLHPRMVDTEGLVRVRGEGRLGNPKISVTNTHGQPVKTTVLKSPDNGLTYVTSMATLVGNTSALSKGRVNLEWTDLKTDKRISVALADVETSEPAAISLNDQHEIQLLPAEGSTLADNQGVWVWPATAPWVPAFTLTARDGRAQLPEALQNAGNLIVQPFTKDPFTILRTPIAPGPFAEVVPQPGFYGENDGALGTLSAFISGESEQVPTSPTVMPVLWDMLATAANGRRDDIISAVRQVFTANPNEALRGLASSLVKAKQQPGRFIETGLVRSRFNQEPPETADYHRAAWIGTLELLGQLGNLYGEEGYLKEEKQQVKELLAQLKELAGENLLDTLKSARDTTLDSACIDKSTVMVAGMDVAQQQFLLNQVFGEHIVPGAVMDDSTRLLAVFETFKQRDQLRTLLASEQLIGSAVTLLRTLRSTNKALYALARIRFDKLDGVDTDAKESIWALAPVVSLVLALASRMAAHGLITSNKTLDAATPAWARLADVIPDLVTSDIVAADAIVLAIAKPGIA